MADTMTDPDEYWYCQDCGRRYKSIAAARHCCTDPED